MSYQTSLEPFHMSAYPIVKESIPFVALTSGGPGAGHEYLTSLTDPLEQYGITIVFYEQIECGRSTHLRKKVGDKWFWPFNLSIAALDYLVDHLKLREKCFYLLSQSLGGMLAGMRTSRRPKGLRKLMIKGLARELPLYCRGRQAAAGSAATRSAQDAGGRRSRRQLRDANCERASAIFYARHTPYNIMQRPSEIVIDGKLRDWDGLEDAKNIHVDALLLMGNKTRPACAGMDYPQLVDAQAGDEASGFLENIVRNHWAHVRLPELRLSVTPNIDPDRDAMIEITIAALEMDRDIILAKFLRPVVVVRQEVGTSEQGDSMDEFLQATVDSIVFGRCTGTIEFLQAVLDELLRRNETQGGDGFDEDEDLNSDSSSSVGSSPYECEITVHLGEITRQVAFSDILTCFWTAQLDTPCHICDREFVNEPPVRTIAKGTDADFSDEINVRVFNRHFSCIQSRGVFFVPVSHVWHDSIRMANEQQTDDNGRAASRLVQTLEGLFEGAEDAYDEGVEFWHDYFSVPQWNRAVKEALLLRLPAIYHVADEILVHLQDFPPAYTTLLLIGSHDVGRNQSVMESIKKMTYLRALCDTSWMQRMWVTLEFSQCRAACVMDGTNHIMRFREHQPDANPVVKLFARDTFSRLVKGAIDNLISITNFANSFVRDMTGPGKFVGRIASRRAEGQGRRDLCLGEAVELVKRKDSFLERDRLLAVHIIADGYQTTWAPNDGLHFPPDQVNACRWVWEKAFARGDYSPLLLQHRESVARSNRTAQQGIPSWLVGCDGLEAAEFGCGNQLGAGLEPLSVDGGVILAYLEVVGRIEKTHFLDVEMSGKVSGVTWALGLLHQIAIAEGTTLSAEQVVDGLNRVFPSDVETRLVARTAANMVFSFEELQERDNTFPSRIMEILDRFLEAPSSAAGQTQREEAAKQLSNLLQLERHILGDISSHITRLDRSGHIADQRRERGSDNGEPICEVRCSNCQQVALFRLDMRQVPQEERTSSDMENVYRGQVQLAALRQRAVATRARPPRSAAARRKNSGVANPEPEIVVVVVVVRRPVLGIFDGVTRLADYFVATYADAECAVAGN
ncbi:hypothetical protein DL765_009918 [Monosporascus sp. GIB2]|nr:hypothetical protein DL765_009918 [Monosporascus sp. GIB2]